MVLELVAGLKGTHMQLQFNDNLSSDNTNLVHISGNSNCNLLCRGYALLCNPYTFVSCTM